MADRCGNVCPDLISVLRCIWPKGHPGPCSWSHTKNPRYEKAWDLPDEKPLPNPEARDA